MAQSVKIRTHSSQAIWRLSLTFHFRHSSTSFLHGPTSVLSFTGNMRWLGWLSGDDEKDTLVPSAERQPAQRDHSYETFTTTATGSPPGTPGSACTVENNYISLRARSPAFDYHNHKKGLKPGQNKGPNRWVYGISFHASMNRVSSWRRLLLLQKIPSPEQGREQAVQSNQRVP